MLRTERTPRRDAVDIDAYELWRACKDVERLLFTFEAAEQRPPAELERLRNWVHKLASANDVNIHSH